MPILYFKNLGSILNILIKILVILLVLLILNQRIFNYHKLSNVLSYYRIEEDYRPDLAIDNTGTYPFISGSNLVFISNYVYDFHVNNIEPQNLKDGDIIFVKIDLIDKFFNNIFPMIDKKFILITQNGDFSTDIKHKKYLYYKKLIAWFGQNPGFQHPKHIPIPIGIENTFYNPKKILFQRNITNLIPWKDRKYLLYLNYNPSTNSKHRKNLHKLFESFDNILIISKKVNYLTYMNHIGNSKYVLCPRGNGLDTHRFYETILMGSIPIVEHSLLDSLYLKTTSLIVNNYSDLTIDILKRPEKHIKNMNFSKDILYLETWLNEIKKYKPDLNIKKLTKF